MEYALTVSGVTKTYGKFKALDGVTLHVPKGSIYGLVGRNGAGKTTLIRIVSGLQSPSAGVYSLYGTENTDRKISRTRRRMGAVVETPSIYLDMTAEDNLKQQFNILGKPDYSDIGSLLKLVGLTGTGRKKAKNFSLGMKQRLGIAAALAGNPDFLILDEPVNGLDPQGIVEIRELILKLNREMGITILISSHILDELSRIATHYGFMDKGRIIREASAEELSSSARKCLVFKVDNIHSLVRYLDVLGTDYKVTEDESVCIYSDTDITTVVTALASDGCRVLSVREQDESLESFFINLLGGEGNA